MTSGKNYIDSGLLEQYVLGCTSPEETAKIELLAAADAAVRMEIEKINEALIEYAMAHGTEPNPLIKPMLLATIDYSERIKNGEPLIAPPGLHNNSLIEDYAAWLNREDMINRGTENIYAKIIGYTPELTTAIVWIKNYAPQEVHDHEIEKFLIVEGSCTITVGDEINELNPGDYFAIPLHKNHVVTVTSMIPCKIILQRAAA